MPNTLNKNRNSREEEEAMATSIFFSHGYRVLRKVIKQVAVGKRFILSSAYECKDAWEKRLHAPLLQSIDMNEYFVQLEKKFNNKQSISGVDIDIFANNITDKDQLEELEHFIYRFRRSRDTVKLFDSTAHAVIRTFLHYEDHENIMRILQDPINYGIFPDYYCYNLLMNNFLKQKNYRDATKIAVLMMLQEDFSHPISKRLALYSCHMYLREPLPGPYLLEEEPIEKKEEKKDEEEEDVFIRVPYLINPFFDDHFDLKEPKLLIGKTLYLLGKDIQGILGKTYQLIGLAMYGKWNKLSKLLDDFSSHKEKPVILRTAIEKCKELINEIPTDSDEKEKWLEELKPRLDKLEESEAVSEGDLHELVMKMAGEIVQFEENDIASQRELYKVWEENRQKSIDEQVQQYLREEKFKLIESKKKELAEKEQLLFFFENWNKIEMELEEVEKLETAVKKQEEEYIPPEIHQGRT